MIKRRSEECETAAPLAQKLCKFACTDLSEIDFCRNEFAIESVDEFERILSHGKDNGGESIAE